MLGKKKRGKPQKFIAVSPDVHKRLKKLTRYGQTMNGIILELLDIAGKMQHRSRDGRFTKK